MYQFRIRVPTDLVRRLGKTHINRSLKTASYVDALAKGRIAAFEIAQTFERARLSQEVPAVLDFYAPRTALRLPEAPICIDLADGWDRYLRDPGSARSQKTILAYHTVRNLVVAILGADRPINDIARRDCRKVLDIIRALPSNYEKRWPGIAPEDAVRRAKAEGVPPMSAANCNGYMGRWSGMMNWLVKEELALRNPCRGLGVVDPIAARDKRRPFSTGQLEAIFTGAPFERLAQVCSGTVDLPSPAQVYVPLIALFSGMRQNEICQMRNDDIAVGSDGIHFFVVRADVETGRRVKTRSSERVVPVHPALIKANLLGHWRRCREQGTARLWPELGLDRFGYASAYFSKWFGRYLSKVGASAQRTSFHSFRHNFRDGLRAARIDRDIAHALGGWTRDGSNGRSAVADAYGGGFPLRLLHEAISKLHYDVAALAMLTVRTP